MFSSIPAPDLLEQPIEVVTFPDDVTRAFMAGVLTDVRSIDEHLHLPVLDT